MDRYAPPQLVSVPLRRRGGRPGPDQRRWIIRPDDLLVVAFDLVNLQVQLGSGADPAKLVKKGPGHAYLVVWFPPQHIIEQAYFTTVEKYPVAVPSNPGQSPPLTDPDQANTEVETPDPPPIDAIISGWSRLVFYVPDDKLPIDWTLPGMLAAIRDLGLSVPANALPPKQKRHFLRDVLTASLKQAVLAQPHAFSTETPAASSPVSAFQVETARSTASMGAVDTFTRATIAGASRVFAVARGRRKVRTVGNTLGLSTVTGSATRDVGLLFQDDLLGKAVSPIQLRPEPAPPGATQTALELPYHLILSPNRFGAWFHVDTPMTSQETGHTELWHTRLGVRREDGTLIDGDDPLRKLRAVWTTDPPPPKTPPPDASVSIPGHTNLPFRASLDRFDRHNVVHLSSNFRLRDGKNAKIFYEPDPLDVDLLALTSLGAWLDSRGAWDFPQPRGLSVEEWRHRATLGRDHYVRVVYAGFLFPFGHRASLVKVTERQFHDNMDGDPAYLRQRMFLIVREPLKTYRSTGLKYDGPDSARTDQQYDLMMQFEAVRILTRVSPLLDPPETDDIDNKLQSCFWPFVGGHPFKFHVIATDTDGNEVDAAMPLIFVGKEETDQDYDNSILPTSVVQAYETAVWPQSSTALRATIPLQGQKLAFAESATPNDTSFAVQTITFGAEVPAKAKFNQIGWRQLRFFPVVRKAQIDVPSLQRIARTSTPASVVFQDLYLREGFSASNLGQVFLAADPDPAAPKLGINFSSQGDRSGGLVTPDMVLSGLSRITGPVSGDLDTVAAGSFSPTAWFGAITGAKLFGVLSLADILDLVGFNELDKLPQFVGQSLNQVEQMISNLERLQKLATVNSVPEISAVASVLDQLLNPTTGSIPALLAGGGVAPVTSQLATLKTELGVLAATLSGSSLPSGPKAAVTQLGSALEKAIAGVLAEVGLLQQFADGDILPQALNARFEWRPVVKPWGPFKPSGDRNLLLSVEATDAQAGGDEVFTVTCALNDFILDLELLILNFERVQIQAIAGKKMDVDVKFTGFEFAGPLSFVQTLREVIPFDGFSDPPDIQVSPSGITAGFSMGLPNLSVGVFSLENLSLGAGFSVPFIGPPMSTWFKFCTRENPSRLTVSLFGGGFYFGVTVNADGLQILEGAIEFGAACSVNFGVASGSVSAMAGLYFKIEGPDVTLAGYFRLRGEVEALGIVSVCIELYLEMRYESASGKCVGTATISIEIDVTLFSVTVEISCTKKFAGSGADPTFAELMDVQPNATSADWDAYCAAFA
jgi:hypothetical protein